MKLESLAHADPDHKTRREFLKTSGKAAVGAALVSAVTRPGYTAEDNTIRVALVGCGGRGTGAAANALATKSGPIKLVAMADLFEERLDRSYNALANDAHGTKGSAVISTFMHTPAKCRIFKGHTITRADMAWAFPQPEPNPYELEWAYLVEAIRQDKPCNEVKRGAEAALVVAMGRKAVHTGQSVLFEEMLNDTNEFAPDVDKLTMNSPAPVRLSGNGVYPDPQPGRLKDREY